MKKVMIIDDSSTVRKFVSFSLKMKGFDVIVAEDGLDALEKMPNDGVDLIITDLNMPNMDGYTLITNIRGSEKFAHIPIIILSSESGDDDIEKGRKLGANAYLVKPFNAMRLQYEVVKFIN